jgi:predicted Zn-dependent peptidase
MSVDRSQLPVVGPDRPFRLPRPVKSQTATGAGLWTIEHREVPVVAMLALLPAGSAQDPAGLHGLAALTADLMDEGAGERDALALHEALARLGAHLEIECTPDATVVGVLTLARHVEAALSLLTDVVFRPRLAQDDFERVRALRRNRLAQMRDLPGATADRVFLETLYREHPYGHLPIGSEDALERVTLDDVRAHHAEAFDLARTTMVVVGDISHEQMRPTIDRALRAVPPAPSTKRAPAPLPSLPPGPPRHEVVLVPRPNAQQSELRVGCVGAARATPDYHALVVANAVLGGQFTSRINLNLREDKGYTYGARSYFDFRVGAGPFVVQVGVQTDATAPALREIFAEMAGLQEARPATGREMELARQGLTRGYARSFETAEQIARAMVQLSLHGLPDDTFDRFIEAVRSVSAEDVTSMARRHFVPADMLTVVVGDQAQVAPALDTLGVPWRVSSNGP